MWLEWNFLLARRSEKVAPRVGRPARPLGIGECAEFRHCVFQQEVSSSSILFISQMKNTDNLRSLLRSGRRLVIKQMRLSPQMSNGPAARDTVLGEISESLLLPGGF